MVFTGRGVWTGRPGYGSPVPDGNSSRLRDYRLPARPILGEGGTTTTGATGGQAQLSEAAPTVTSMADEPHQAEAPRYPPAVERKARAWVAAASPDEGVGARHHTVPAFYLRYFADGDQLLVRRIPEHAPILCNLHDLAQRDFYTAMTDDPDGGAPRPDGRIEQVLRIVEGNAARVLGRLRNPLLVRRPLPMDERRDVTQFLAFQLVRGVRMRREIELLAEYHVKLTAGGRAKGDDDAPTLDELARVRVVPHPNEHLRMLGSIAERAHPFLRERPVCVVELDRPLLFTCDEPVLVIVDDIAVGGGHTPDCFLTERERRKRRRRAFARGEQEVGDLVHLLPTRQSGIAIAEEIALPLDARRLLLLGPHGTDSEPYIRVTGEAADELAADVTRRLLDQAYLWVAGHPQHPTLRQINMPEPGPVLRICDGGSVFSQTLDEAPTPRQPARLRRDWV